MSYVDLCVQSKGVDWSVCVQWLTASIRIHCELVSLLDYWFLYIFSSNVSTYSWSMCMLEWTFIELMLMLWCVCFEWTAKLQMISQKNANKQKKKNIRMRHRVNGQVFIFSALRVFFGNDSWLIVFKCHVNIMLYLCLWCRRKCVINELNNNSFN